MSPASRAQLSAEAAALYKVYDDSSTAPDAKEQARLRLIEIKKATAGQ